MFVARKQTLRIMIRQNIIDKKFFLLPAFVIIYNFIASTFVHICSTFLFEHTTQHFKVNFVTLLILFFNELIYSFGYQHLVSCTSNSPLSIPFSTSPSREERCFMHKAKLHIFHFNTKIFPYKK